MRSSRRKFIVAVLWMPLTPACALDTFGLSAGDPGPTSVASVTSVTGGTASTSAETTTPTTGSGDPDSTSGTSEASATSCTPTPWYLDVDMDDHGDPKAMQLACDQPRGHVEVGDDCDDQDAARAPSLVEICDDKDNDCDLLVDESSVMNTSCKDCLLMVIGTSSYAHCMFARTYQDARIECQQRGGDLAVIQDDSENAALTEWALQVKGPATIWYIGLDDAAVEGSFLWVDGSPVGFSGWAPGEPSNTGGIEDCAVLYAGDGSWNDQQCNLAVLFICEAIDGV